MLVECILSMSTPFSVCCITTYTGFLSDFISHLDLYYRLSVNCETGKTDWSVQGLEDYLGTLKKGQTIH